MGRALRPALFLLGGGGAGGRLQVASPEASAFPAPDELPDEALCGVRRRTSSPLTEGSATGIFMSMRDESVPTAHFSMTPDLRG